MANKTVLNIDVLDKLSDNIVDRMDNTNEYILRQIGESIKKIGALTPSKAQELGQIMKYGGDYNKIVKELSKQTGITVKELNELFDRVAKENYAFAEQFYNYRHTLYLPYKDNVVLVNAVEAIKRTALQDFINLSATTALGYGLMDDDGNIVFTNLQDAYNKIIDEAVISIGQGKDTYVSAMKKRMDELCESGLRVIYPTTYVDKNGIVKHHSRRLDSAMRMNIVDGVNQVYNQEQRILGEQFESDGVEISSHIYPAPDHALLQGRQFSNVEFNKLENQEKAITYDGIIIPANSNRRQIGTLNCKHNILSIVLGVSRPRRSKEELQKVLDDNEKGFTYEGKHYTLYEATQLQRQLELGMRKTKDGMTLVESSGIGDLDKLTNRYKELKRKHKEVSLLLNKNTEVRI